MTRSNHYISVPATVPVCEKSPKTQVLTAIIILKQMCSRRKSYRIRSFRGPTLHHRFNLSEREPSRNLCPFNLHASHIHYYPTASIDCPFTRPSRCSLLHTLGFDAEFYFPLYLNLIFATVDVCVCVCENRCQKKKRRSKKNWFFLNQIFTAILQLAHLSFTRDKHGRPACSARYRYVSPRKKTLCTHVSPRRS
jgi:hypothetical protein